MIQVSSPCVPSWDHSGPRHKCQLQHGGRKGSEEHRIETDACVHGIRDAVFGLGVAHQRQAHHVVEALPHVVYQPGAAHPAHLWKNRTEAARANSRA
eukprot:scaffold142419_cov301-Phaeocystis_antarctica.AAC.2